MIEINNKTRTRPNIRMVRSIAEAFLKKYKREGDDVSIAFVGAGTMKRLNRTYRGKDGTTDILSFEGEEGMLGELVIDYAQIKRQATDFSNSADRELAFILVHGLYHLIGFADDTEKERLRMVRMGEAFLRNLRKRGKI